MMISNPLVEISPQRTGSILLASILNETELLFLARVLMEDIAMSIESGLSVSEAIQLNGVHYGELLADTLGFTEPEDVASLMVSVCEMALDLGGFEKAAA